MKTDESRIEGRRLHGGALVGLDVGSTIVKAAAFDPRGRLIALASRPVPVLRPRPDWVERDAEATWRAAAAVLRAVASRVPRIAALGVTGCGNGAVLIDGRGRVLRPGILSGDTRAAGMVSLLRPGHARPYAGQTACLLRWLEAREPATVKRASMVLFWKDFIRLRMTGESCTDYTDAGASGLLDFEKRRWRSHGRLLPPLRGSTAGAGGITARASARTGLAAGTPVFTGAIDCEATALGSGISKAGDLSVVAGTWAINQAYSRKPAAPGALFLCNLSARSDRWLLLEGGPGSAANLDWAVRILLGRPDLARGLRMAAAAPRSQLLFVPGVASGKGIFAGLDASHRAGDLLRAVMEGVVYSHRVQIERLEAAGPAFARVRLAGGASQSPLWCQLFADGLGMPVEVPHGTELGALGAALCAGVGLGRWASLPEAQQATVRVSRTFIPAAVARETMFQGYRRFKDLGRHPAVHEPGLARRNS